MNREQKRNFKKKVKKYTGKGYDKFVSEILDKMQEYTYLNSGDKVVMDYDRITSHPGYKTMNERYKKFVEESRGKVFTVQPAKSFKQIVCLEEDESDPKWFFYAGDLVIVAKKDQGEVVNEETKNDEN